MSIITNAFARTLAFATGREPRASALPARPADPHHADTNSDDSVRWIRSFVSTGPARCAPTSGDAAGSVPTPTGTLRGGGYGTQPHLDRSVRGNHPLVPSPTPSGGLPYGVHVADRGDVAQPGGFQPRASNEPTAQGSIPAGRQSGSDGRVRR